MKNNTACLLLIVFINSLLMADHTFTVLAKEDFATLTNNILYDSTEYLQKKLEVIQDEAKITGNERLILEYLKTKTEEKLHYYKAKNHNYNIKRYDHESLVKGALCTAAFLAISGLIYALDKKFYGPLRQEFDLVSEKLKNSFNIAIEQKTERLLNTITWTKYVKMPNTLSPENKMIVWEMIDQLRDISQRREKSRATNEIIIMPIGYTWFLSGIGAIVWFIDAFHPPHKLYYEKYTLLGQKIDIALKTIKAP